MLGLDRDISISQVTLITIYLVEVMSINGRMSTMRVIMLNGISFISAIPE